jgi:hypothetical protein
MKNFTLTVGGRRVVNGVLEIESVGPGGILLPPGGGYKLVIHDQFSPDGKDRIGMPEVWPLYISSYSDLTSAWQWYWFRVGLVHPFTGYETWDERKLSAADFRRLKAEWSSLTHGAKAFTNNHGTEQYTNYITGERNEGGTPKQGDIITCGNIVKVLGPKERKGTPIETLDGMMPPPHPEIVNRLTRPDLLFAATNVAANKEDGYGDWKPVYFWKNGIRYERVDPFPNMWGVPGARSIDTIIPLRSNGQKAAKLFGRSARYSKEYTLSNGTNVMVHFAKNYIDSHRLTPVEGLYVPTPYVMP